MKISTMKAWLERNQILSEFLKEGGMSGEYFFLTPAVTQAIDEFIEKTEDGLEFGSINDLKLPFDSFTIETSAEGAEDLDDLVNSNPGMMYSVSRTYHFERSEGEISVFICEKMKNRIHGLSPVPKNTIFIFADRGSMMDDKSKGGMTEVLWLGDKNWNVWTRAGSSEITKEAVFEVGISHWNPEMEKHYGESFDSDFWSKEMFEWEMQNGMQYALTGFKFALALSLIKTGIKQTKTQCSVIPVKSNGRKRKPAPRKHFFTTVSLEAVETISGNEVVKRKGVTAHTVRGHFKKRKNGLFWWNPFVRGSGKIRERDGYAVKG